MSYEYENKEDIFQIIIKLDFFTFNKSQTICFQAVCYAKLTMFGLWLYIFCTVMKVFFPKMWNYSFKTFVDWKLNTTQNPLHLPYI